MTKIKSKPTAAECRVLVALREGEERGLFVNWRASSIHSSIWHYPYSAMNKWARLEYGKPRTATIRNMVERGWLENPATVEYKFSMDIRMSKEGKCPWHWILSEVGRELAESLTDDDLLSPKAVHNAHDIMEVLKKKHPVEKWVFIPELRLGTGFQWGGSWRAGNEMVQADQRIDAWAMHLWPSKKFLKIAYEIKVSKADFKKELEHPNKKNSAMMVSNLFYFAAPAGIIDPKDLPDLCGLIEIQGDSFSKIVAKAIWRESCDPSWNFIASIGRRLQ